MKLLVDFFPLLAFLLVFKTRDIYWATAALILATIVQITYTWFTTRKVEKMHLITLVSVFVFGSITIAFRNPVFIQWKVTVVDWVFAAALLLSQFVWKKPLLKRMLGKGIRAPDHIWSQLNVAWAIFFLVLSVVNLYIAYNWSEAAWVNFKVFGTLGASLLGVILTVAYIYKFSPMDAPWRKEDESE
jgi:intracellular septation protein